MDAQQLNACFGDGMGSVKTISVRNAELSTAAWNAADKSADVQEQQHVATADFDAATGALLFRKDPNGEGLWIPWLGQGSLSSERA